MEFAIGGCAAMGACIFTNPLEVLKTRMQLQGELKGKGKHAILYRNVFHAGYVVVVNEGIFALQKGLVPALLVQLVMNGMRFGTYDFFRSRGLTVDPTSGQMVFWRSAMVSGTGGILGQLASSPFFLVKTHLQSQAAQQIAVGYQHHHQGASRALISIYKKHGVRGMFRGATATIPRAFVGSISQLMSFEYSKQALLSRYPWLSSQPILASFLGSMVGGIAVSIAMTPFDLIMTRLYNQPTDANGKGLTYSSYLDCVKKIYKSEGASAFYKGVGPMYLRLGPHTVLSLVFWDQLRSLYDNMYKSEKKIPG